jgi:hypothetical protein
MLLLAGAASSRDDIKLHARPWVVATFQQKASLPPQN